MKKIASLDDWQFLVCALRSDPSCSVESFVSALESCVAAAKREAAEELKDWQDSAKSAARESCGDEVHCTCVGVLRKRIKDLEALTGNKS